jgi:hypothetical protein
MWLWPSPGYKPTGKTVSSGSRTTNVDQAAAISWSEFYTALQTGVADGQMNPIPIIAFAKFQEVQKYLTLNGSQHPDSR